MEYSILGGLTDREKLEQWYPNNKTRFDKHRGKRSIVWTTFVYWLVALFCLFVLLAYRPLISVNEDSFLYDLHTYRQTQPAGQVVVLENRYGSRNFTEYLSRTFGLMPAACTVSEMSIQIPPVASGVEPDTSSPPFPLSFLLDVQEFQACRWRNEFSSILVAFSPSVGTVQKLTLFLLILGLVLVRRAALQLDLDSVCFPGRSKSRVWKDNKDKDTRMLVHPILNLPGSESDNFYPLYPTQTISLDGKQESKEAIAKYRNDVNLTRMMMVNNQLKQPFDLILNVLDSGAKHRRVGPMTDRLASATFDFRERVSSRLWFVDYILWFLPTIGFLGTIYGISVSLSRAKGLFDQENDFSEVIRKVVDGLGVAFDTTSMALACSAVLYLALRRTEAKIGPLVDRAEETLTELLVDSFVDNSISLPSPSSGSAEDSSDGDDETLAGAPGEREKPDDASVLLGSRRRPVK